MKRIFASILFVISFSSIVIGQMWNGQDSLYGNEWINANLDYYKFEITTDGLYRISKSVLQDAGFPISTQPGSSFRLYGFGEEIPLYVSTGGFLGNSDYVEFYAEKNRFQLDQHLFQNPEEEALNPEYSMFSDTAYYFLTATGNGTPLRFEETSNNLGAAGTPASYFLHESKLIFDDKAYSWSNSDNVKYSHFDSGEGFASQYSGEHDLMLSTPALYPSGPNSVLDVKMVSSILIHEMELKWNGTTIAEENYSGFGLRKIHAPIGNTSVSETNTIEVLGNFDNNDRYAVSVISLTYPRSFDFSGAGLFDFTINNGNQQYLEIDNFGYDNGDPILYDLTNHKRIVTDQNNSQVRVVLPQGQSNRKLVLSNNGSGVKMVSSISKINFPDLSNSEANYIIITHPNLNKSIGGTNQVLEYKNFRESALGGSYNVQIVEVTDIYDVFGYGVPRHSISLRNFGNFIRKNWSNIEMVFLLGKGRDYSVTRKESQLTSAANSSFHIPTFGTPGSDNLLFASNSSDVSVIPMGRLAAQNHGEILTYLNKMKDMAQVANLPQTIEDKAWQKNILHLSGGDVNIQNTIANNLRLFEEIVENNTFGADVTTFYKTSTDPIQISQTEEIFELINEGVSLITFFGHSGTGTFDFNIDNPDNFDNSGKLPLIISLGCYSGNIHTSGEGVSERFVFYEDKGASSFLATTGPGYISALRTFGLSFYNKFGEDNYGEPLGKILRETLLPLDGSTSITIRTLVQQLTLNGDPALLMNPHPGPDFVVDSKSVHFDPEFLNAQLDSFKLSFDLVNLGNGVSDSIDISISQRIANGEIFEVGSRKIPAPRNSETLEFSVGNLGRIATGLNRFFITLDDQNEIDELPTPFAENNNELVDNNNQPGVSKFIFDDSAIPVFPDQFDIVSDTEFSLMASSPVAVGTPRDFVFQIDTTELFNSPLMETGKINQIGGLIKYTPNSSFNDNTVYYWRVSPDSINASTGFAWDNSSFLFLNGSENGWNQSHYYQYTKDDFLNMEIPETKRKFKFVDDVLTLTVKNKVNEANDKPSFAFGSTIYNEMFKFTNHTSVSVAVAQPNGKFIKTDGLGTVGNVEQYSVPQLVHVFRVNTEENRSNLINFIQSIPDDHTVWVYSQQWSFAGSRFNLRTEEWKSDSINLGTNIFQVLENEGVTKVRELETKGSVPFVFLFKKNRGLIEEKVADDANGTIIVTHNLVGLWDEGSIKSTFIGPAKSWERAEINVDYSEIPENDTVGITIYGSLNGTDENEILIENSTMSEIDLSQINASTHPFLRLEFNSKDVVEKTSAHLNFWRVYFEPVPEFAINTADHFAFISDTLDHGEDFSMEYAIDNVSNTNSDSLLIKYTIVDRENKELVVTKRIAPFGPLGSTQTEFGINTASITGAQTIQVELNPANDQAEKYAYNNFLINNLFIKGDIRNPNMDVTFDGVHIMDGDLVSASPEIRIQLEDENIYFPLNDTSIFKLFFTYPDEEVRRVYFSEDILEFFPAQGDRNVAYLNLSPKFEQDGEYKFIIQASDISGNSSGRSDFKVNFRVINEKMISNVLNYPNPFSTSTQFVYTLTGDSAPAYFKIQILSVSGKIVKEITQDELGPLKVGTHRTDYRWDGTDDYGDQLANGIYLYRVVVNKENGTSYKSLINGSIDSFFEQGFGKMVLMR